MILFPVLGNRDPGGGFICPELAGGMRLRGPPSFPGNANYSQDCNYCNVLNFDYPIMLEGKILDICFQGRN
jgi:hypothetical protein